jgi:hypothetical protein
VIATRGDLRQRGAIGILGACGEPLDREDRVEPRRLADDGGHLEHAALGGLHHAEPRGDDLLVALG